MNPSPIPISPSPLNNWVRGKCPQAQLLFFLIITKYDKEKTTIVSSGTSSFDFQQATRQTEDRVWRNVVVSKKNQRIRTLMFHADSLFEGGLYGEAKQTYDLAFTEDRYILPYHLSEVARKMMGIRNDDAAQTYLSHRRRNTARRWDLTVSVRCWMPRVSMSGEREVGLPPIEMK